MRLIVILNKDKSINDLLHIVAHLCLGIGARLPNDRLPHIEIVLADDNLITRARKVAINACHSSPFNTTYSEYVAPTDNINANTPYRTRIADKSPEKLHYDAIALCGSEDSTAMMKTFVSSQPGCEPIPIPQEINPILDRGFTLKPALNTQATPDISSPDQGLIIILPPGLPNKETALTITSQAALKFANTPTYLQALALKAYADAAGTLHPPHTQYPIGVVTTDSTASHDLIFNLLGVYVASGTLMGQTLGETTQLQNACHSFFGNMAEIESYQTLFQPWENATQAVDASQIRNQRSLYTNLADTETATSYTPAANAIVGRSRSGAFYGATRPVIGRSSDDNAFSDANPFPGNKM